MFLRDLRIDSDTAVERRLVEISHSTKVMIAKYKDCHQKNEHLTLTFQTWDALLELNWLDRKEIEALVKCLTEMMPAPPKPKRKVVRKAKAKKKTAAKKKTTTRSKTKAK